VYGYQELQFARPVTEQIYEVYPAAPYQSEANNYATDYIRFNGAGDITVNFHGQTNTRLADVQANSGRYAWWSNKGDASDSTLTRPIDLRTATPGAPLVMEVAMWWEIEEHYDYGYVLASRDGKKWDILPGQSTTTDNPSGNSFGPGYTSNSPANRSGSPAWVNEQFDLSAYAGEMIWLRFEYVTDDGINSSGWLIDDIAIPAINLADDFEMGANGWVSEGWVRTDNQLSQRWLLQVLEFTGDHLTALRRIEVDANGQAHMAINGLGNERWAVLAISPLAVVTTEPALYELRVDSIE
jgi:hypothetical protein